MPEEIKNRVAESKIVTFDLEDYYPKGERVLLDISAWLYEQMILKEKDSREMAKNPDLEHDKYGYVALYCFTDAIIPAWAIMVITTYLSSYAKKGIVGELKQLETSLYQEIIENM